MNSIENQGPKLRLSQKFMNDLVLFFSHLPTNRTYFVLEGKKILFKNLDVLIVANINVLMKLTAFHFEYFAQYLFYQNVIEKKSRSIQERCKKVAKTIAETGIHQFKASLVRIALRINTSKLFNAFNMFTL